MNQRWFSSEYNVAITANWLFKSKKRGPSESSLGASARIPNTRYKVISPTHAIIAWLPELPLLITLDTLDMWSAIKPAEYEFKVCEGEI